MEKFTKKVASILISLSVILTSSCAQRVTVVDENASTEKFIFNDVPQKTYSAKCR